TIYAGSLSEDRRELRDVFFYQRATEPNQPDRMILAERASRVTDPDEQASIVDLQNGRQYQLRAGQAAYSRAEFSYYRLRIEHESSPEAASARLETASLTQLWQDRAQSPVMAELGWRLSMPWVMVLACVLAVPLAQVNPRQGRYLRLLPSIFLFATIVVTLMAVKTRVSKDELGSWAFVAVLLGYLTLAIGMTVRYRMPSWRTPKPPQQPPVQEQTS
ncbi:MAG: LptF/LptG family permease, partial [Pseudomonadota bacterium]|nr:LptF/LptG family permease [Pseudomonadota bacterium]